MRRLLTCLLTACALLLAACGDNEETTGGESAETQTQAQTAATEPTTTGCRAAEEPGPKDVGDVEKPTFRVRDDVVYTAVLQTSCGPIEIELASEEAPRTASSFIALVRDGFYDGLAWHRIVPDFVVQGGDPEGTGEGGPGYEVVEAPPEDLKYEKGVVAMAKTELDDPGTSGSQFFIVAGADAGLPPDYALLGRVKKGFETLDRLAAVPNDPADNRPTEPVIIEKATIETAPRG
jgi:peptidyl-prolyl cis-trans isomerase B (cyclophilin B)